MIRFRRKGYPPIAIETERFRLETMRPFSFARATMPWTNDADVMNPLGFRSGNWKFRQWWRQLRKKRRGKAISVAIWTKQDRTLIGFQSANISGQNAATIAIAIGDREWWGRNVVLEVRSAFIDYLFKDIGVVRITGMPPVRNFPSVYNYQRLGFTLEGTMRRFLSDGQGGLVDCFIFGMLPEEWDGARIQNEKEA